MSKQDKPVEDKMIACSVCMKEIPASEAMVDEAAEYVRYYCGLECFEKWKAQSEPPKK